MKKMKKGFTIVELVIVIAVIAILAAVLIPTFTSVTEKAKESAALQEAKNAFTITYAEALADGNLANDDKDATAENVQLKSGKYTFTVSEAGTLLSVVLEDGAYNYTVSGGALTGVTKKTN